MVHHAIMIIYKMEKENEKNVLNEVKYKNN
jgi:hypothetical protein